MRLTRILLSALAALQIASYTAYAEESPRNVKTLTDWEFRRDHDWKAGEGWTAVKVPHDWAITGPFSKENDLQVVAVVQNGEKQATEKTLVPLIPATAAAITGIYELSFLLPR